ncbi:integrase core domain-containing protein [Qipengyuania flava]|nr:integrase core domain-containing protein [Qipengyuania flava]
MRASAGRLCDEPPNKTLFMSLTHAWVEIAGRQEDYSRVRPHSALGCASPAAFAAEHDSQCPASIAPMRKNHPSLRQLAGISPPDDHVRCNLPKSSQGFNLTGPRQQIRLPFSSNGIGSASSHNV